MRRIGDVAGREYHQSALSDLLAECQITKADLARRAGVHPNTVTRWGDDPPQIVIAYLELLAKVKRIARS